ncbi:hypothetical protein BDQ12DRAFT_297633 [Crucibulum laeve]|uniref:Uncharacterized protein n=1 Tax=Crucibulum laeve TaxID=68775 RepID=A0A5C3MDQ6_9AGAR|nr:hypothetical protein BDQ12DRAFT_297633 [Crucibulum laeve]
MDQVKAAAEALRQIAATKKHKTDVEDSIHQFASTITLLELSSLSPNTFERLSSLLRARLLPLYYAFFELTLQYTNAILTVIFEEKITNTVFAGDDFIRSSWEMIQTSLISGVLDYLEAESTYEHRGTVGNALYPILCRFYLQEAPFKPTQTTGSLLSTVYQLLSETVISHPNNQRKLRDPGILGGKAIGRTLSQIKDFLAAEALLELFANLLPSLNGPTGRGKRTAYIKETFNPAFFTCSEEIITLLENITTIDWSVTAIKIMDTLATSDILFPQPFEVSRCIMQSKRINNVDRIYIDNYAFLANLDENGNLETIQIPYMTINSVALTSSSNNNTSVKVEVLSLPLVGGRPSAEISSTDNIGLSWEINTADVERFTSSLRKRGLGEKMKKSARKLSKAITQVELDFDAADGKVFSTSAQV